MVPYNRIRMVSGSPFCTFPRPSADAVHSDPSGASLAPVPGTRPSRFSGGDASRTTAATARRAAGLAGECSMRRSRATLAAQRFRTRFRTTTGDRGAATASPVGTGCAAPGFLTRVLGRPQIYTCTPCLGQADGDRLLRRARAVFALANVMHLLANKLARLGAGGFALALVAPCPPERGSFRHKSGRWGSSARASWRKSWERQVSEPSVQDCCPRCARSAVRPPPAASFAGRVRGHGRFVRKSPGLVRRSDRAWVWSQGKKLS